MCLAWPQGGDLVFLADAGFIAKSDLYVVAFKCLARARSRPDGQGTICNVTLPMAVACVRERPSSMAANASNRLACPPSFVSSETWHTMQLSHDAAKARNDAEPI